MKHMQLVLDFLIFSFKMAGDTGGRRGHGPALFCIENRKRGNKGEKKKLLKGCHQGPNVAALAILGVWNSKHFLLTCWPTILFSFPWSLHFEIHFAGHVSYSLYHTTTSHFVIVVKI